MRPTIIEDGEISKSGGGTLIVGWRGRAVKTGEKLYVYDVRVEDEYVLLMLGMINTVDVVKNRSTKAVAQQAAVSFRFKEMPTMTAEKVIAAIKPWFLKADEASESKTISIGQTKEDVEKVLGKPSKIAQLESKIVYFYPDMKVTFVDGKVKDIQ
jgi:hypothetical protein